MIHITARSGADGYALWMRGHADYHPGNDIVCAGASAIVCALAGYLHNAQGHLYELLEERLEHGDACIRFRGDAAAGEAFKMALVGLLQLQESYPEHLSIRMD